MSAHIFVVVPLDKIGLTYGCIEYIFEKTLLQGWKKLFDTTQSSKVFYIIKVYISQHSSTRFTKSLPLFQPANKRIKL